MTKIDKFELDILKAFVLKKDRSYLIAHPELSLNENESKYLQQLIQLREQGVPIAYILGKRAFWTLEFKVSNEVLIPRHETEILVEVILNTLDKNESLAILELGTGSGAISIVLAKERPQYDITATDVSEGALT